jgi:hypothetical protein
MPSYFLPSPKVDSFNLGVAGYMIKPVDYQKFVESFRSVVFMIVFSKIDPPETNLK